MKTLNSEFRVDPAAHAYHQGQPITPDNVDAWLDRGLIQVAMRSGNFWTIRRNGATKRWKRDASRIRIPFKMGLYGYGCITETDFVEG